jgi:Cu+-exporting ATPase
VAQKINLPIDGMHCQSCVNSVTRSLQTVPGVGQVAVDLAGRLAHVEYNAEQATRDDLARAIEAAGFRVPASAPAPPVVALQVLQPAPAPRPAEPLPSPAAAAQAMVSQRLGIQGMHCASCVGRVEQALTSLPGVKAARANLPLEQALVEYDPSQVAWDQLARAVEASGYRAVRLETDNQSAQDYQTELQRQQRIWLWRALTGTAILVVLMGLHWSGMHSTAAVWTAAILATVAQVYLGAPFLLGFWQRLRHFDANMDTLIALGTSTAYFAGLAQSISGHGGMYFHDAVMILTFITWGRWLEAKAKRRSSQAILKLLDLSPPVATVVRGDQRATLPVQDIAVGETIEVRPGDKIPLDGVVQSGNSAVDEAWLTGESVPVDKQSGDKIFAGTINGSGALIARTTSTSDRTALAQIIELVRHAQESKPHWQRLADRIIRLFVPAVLLLAALTFAGWGFWAGDWTMAISATVAVLVVACPCALGLATPTAILVGSGRGAEQGILIKDAAALERACEVDTVVFDKTGTLTAGKFRLQSTSPLGSVSQQELIATAASLERLSSHPIAQAIVRAAQDQRVSVPAADNLQVIPGVGLSGRVSNRQISIGNDRLREQLISPSSWPDALWAERIAAGDTPLAVVADGQMLGVLGVSDELAPHARDAVAALRRQGLQVQLLSGDRRTTAQAIAAQVGIDLVLAEVLPDQKHAEIERLRATGARIAMVGDGINDAAALAAADLGIAMGAGADVAIESADIVLSRHDLRGVPSAIALSRATRRTIQQNLIWALAYNILLLPLAAGLLVPWNGWHLPPAAAAAAMAASSLSVVGNSLWLRNKRLPI